MNQPSARTQLALLTPPGRSALATILLVGPSAPAIIERLFRPIAKSPLSSTDPGPHYGEIGIDPVDDVVLTWRAHPQNPAAEIHCHGGPALVEGLLRQLEAEGATRVDWRALLSFMGTSPITIEATDALARALTVRAARILLDQQTGQLENAWQQLTGPEAQVRARELLAWESLGKHLTEPWRVLLMGRPNVGKSSLLNAIVGHGRAIVSPHAGTTRDLVSALAAIDGWPILFLDGAGLRQTADPLEQAGIDRVHDQASAVDLKLFIVESPVGITTTDQTLIDQLAPDIIVTNKIDLGDARSKTKQTTCNVSATIGVGIDELLAEIVRRLVPRVPAPGTPIPFTDRQRRELHSLALTQA